ncbi:MAG: hypothetical protein M1268_02770 [Patescibacteria group bacterium]|nr:hypothetical protein [Patescibacteria group bacterium]
MISRTSSIEVNVSQIPRVAVGPELLSLIQKAGGDLITEIIAGVRNIDCINNGRTIQVPYGQIVVGKFPRDEKNAPTGNGVRSSVKIVLDFQDPIRGIRKSFTAITRSLVAEKEVSGMPIELDNKVLSEISNTIDYKPPFSTNPIGIVFNGINHVDPEHQTLTPKKKLILERRIEQGN